MLGADEVPGGEAGDIDPEAHQVPEVQGGRLSVGQIGPAEGDHLQAAVAGWLDRAQLLGLARAPVDHAGIAVDDGLAARVLDQQP